MRPVRVDPAGEQSSQPELSTEPDLFPAQARAHNPWDPPGRPSSALAPGRAASSQPQQRPDDPRAASPHRPAVDKRLSVVGGKVNTGQYGDPRSALRKGCTWHLRTAWCGRQAGRKVDQRLLAMNATDRTWRVDAGHHAARVAGRRGPGQRTRRRRGGPRPRASDVADVGQIAEVGVGVCREGQ